MAKKVERHEFFFVAHLANVFRHAKIIRGGKS
jgi:hypothetical protein